MRHLGLFLVVMLGCGQEEPNDALLRVSLTNVSSPGALGGKDIVLAPGVWATLRSHAQLFAVGSQATPGLERYAEDADRDAFLAELMDRDDVEELGGLGLSGDDVIGPGDVVEFEVSVGEQEHLQLATMYVHGNDIMLASKPSWPSTLPLEGTTNQTTTLDLYDAGTERNELPGGGPNQLLQQEAPGAGEPEDDVIGPIDDEFNYPPIDRIVELAIDRIE